MAKMTPLRQKFCDEYVKCKDATQAYRNAGGKAKNASVAGYEILRIPKCWEYIQEKLQQVSVAANVDAAKLLLHTSQALEADLSDIIDPETGAYRPVHEWPKIWRQMVNSVDIKVLYDKKGNRIGEILKPKFVDRNKLAEIIGKHVDVQAFKDRVEHDISDRLADRIMEARRRARAGKSE